jgi:CBS domain containing-hemolysin-like protein
MVDPVTRNLAVAGVLIVAAGVCVAMGLGLVGIHRTVLGYGAFLPCEIQVFVPGRVSRRTSLRNAVMITAAVLMVISLAFVSRAYSARRPKPWANFLVRFHLVAAIE